MAELTQKERLQPSLLDRLADANPRSARESREERVLSMHRLRECVLRDLTWLLNCERMDSHEDLEEFPHVRESVLNFGIPALSGSTLSGVDIAELERQIRQAIWDFEPRILRNTVEVRGVVDEYLMSKKSLSFEIEGELWAQPVPLRLFLRTELDLDTGTVTIEDSSR